MVLNIEKINPAGCNRMACCTGLFRCNTIINNELYFVKNLRTADLQIIADAIRSAWYVSYNC